MDHYFIGALAVSLPFVMVIFVIGFTVYEKIKKQQIQADLYAKALEKGQPIPPGLFADTKKKHNPLNTGIICIAVGIGISMFLWLASDDEEMTRAATVGIIPFLIGVAYLVIHFIGKKQGTDENTQ